MDDKSVLQGILLSCDRLPMPGPEQQIDVELTSVRIVLGDVTLNLGRDQLDNFTKLLHEEKLSSALTPRLLSLYQGAVDNFKAAIANLTDSIATDGNITQQMVSNALLRFVERKCELLGIMILTTVREAKRNLDTAVQTAYIEPDEVDSDDSDSDDDSDDESDEPSSRRPGARKHPARALRILELAFERSNNITHAEKTRIAEAIGLQPRQVTVWFQNRRNRRKPAAAAATAAKTPKSPSAAAANGRKRKIAAVTDENEAPGSPRLPLSLPEKRQKVDRAPSSESDLSSLSSADDSFTFDKTPFENAFGVMRKPRNDSGNSSITTTTDTSVSSSSSTSPSSVEKEDSPIEIEEVQPVRDYQPAPSDFLFHADGTIQPNWDDLELDLGQLEASLTSTFNMSMTDFGGNPSQSAVVQQPLTPTSLRRLQDATPTSSTFAQQQLNMSSIAAFNAICNAENWSMLDSGMLGTSQQPSEEPSDDDWSQAVLKLDCEPVDLSETLKLMEDFLKLPTPADLIAQANGDGSLSSSTSSASSSSLDLSTTTSNTSSSLHLDFDFDFTQLGFVSTPDSSPGLSSDVATFATTEVATSSSADTKKVAEAPTFVLFPQQMGSAAGQLTAALG